MTLAPDRAAPVELNDQADAAVVRVRADLDNAVSEHLRRVLAEVIDRRAHVVVDLAAAPTVDPAGLAVLVRAHRKARRNDCVLCLVAPSRFVRTVLHTMHIDGVFPQFSDCASALAWLRQGSPALSTGR
jgi:anti-anti-sigma factor